MIIKNISSSTSHINIIKIFHHLKYDLKGHLRSHKVLLCFMKTLIFHRNKYKIKGGHIRPLLCCV